MTRRTNARVAGFAWLGAVASLILVVGLPLRLVEVVGGQAAQLMWLPMARPATAQA